MRLQLALAGEVARGLERTAAMSYEAAARPRRACRQAAPARALSSLLGPAIRRGGRLVGLGNLDRCVRRAGLDPLDRLVGLGRQRGGIGADVLELGLAPADVAVQLGHTDGGALVMSTYGHPSERAARARITAAMDGYETGELRAFRGRGEA